ncbi:GNAT family N-acetyltransferase [Micromonospora sp. LOL_025]|uniref:GNAT family N-acetyltransferase n=1 Tax=Micromonospora sp. LOL_025 TaxID=3345413 RepID=UPI003A872F63
MLLTLRPLALDDTAAVHDWARLPESCRYQAWGPNTYEQTQAYVRAAVAAPRTGWSSRCSSTARSWAAPS